MGRDITTPPFRPLTVTVNEASAKAIQKVEAAGGSVKIGEGEDWGEREEE